MSAKVCRGKCGLALPLHLFVRNGKSRDGRGPCCLKCSRDQQRAYRRRANGIPTSEMLYPEFTYGTVWSYEKDGKKLTLIVDRLQVAGDSFFRIMGTKGERIYADWMRAHGTRVEPRVDHAAE